MPLGLYYKEIPCQARGFCNDKCVFTGKECAEENRDPKDCETWKRCVEKSR